MPNCMADDGLGAVFVGTFLSNGQSVAVCDEHLVYFCADTLHTMTGVDPMPFLAAISDDGPEAPPDDPEEPPQRTGVSAEPEPADPTKPTRSSGRLRAVSSAPPTAGAGEQDTTIADAAVATPAG